MADNNAVDKKKKSNVADAEYKKKSLIFCGVLLLVFLVAVVVVLVNAWYNGVHVADMFEDERKAAIATPKKERLDTSSVEIDVNDNTFYYWTTELDDSYQKTEDDDGYGIYEGCTIHIQGVLEKKGNEKNEYYWICRKSPVDNSSVDTTAQAHATKETTAPQTTAVSTSASSQEVQYQTLAITVKSKGKMPKDGEWVDAVGTVTVDKFGFACVDDAKITVLEKPGKLVVN